MTAYPCLEMGCVNNRISNSGFCANHTIPGGTLTPKVDERYNTPKMEPSAHIEDIEKVIGDTEIYRRARALINSSQRRQVGYGMEKYPNPLNADTWSTIETIDHIIEESIDKLHYLVMLRIKLESQGNS